MKVSKHKEFLQKCLFNYCNTYISVKKCCPRFFHKLEKNVLNSRFEVEFEIKMGFFPFQKTNMASISCIFESVAILKFEHGAVDYSRRPIFILIRFWESKKFFAESPCILSFEFTRISTKSVLNL
jgi:hypothetical protein